MNSDAGRLSSHGSRVGFVLLCLVLIAMSRPLIAAPEFYLVTYGPGPEVWERFGHNALWLHDSETDENALYNFGFFDFEQPGFMVRFLKGRMRYYAAVTEPEYEFPFYQQRHRSIEYQPLRLDAEQARRLAALLRKSVQPEHREYRYDYFFANCSTQVRDALDQVLDGLVAEKTADISSAATFRESALIKVQDNFWLYTGMQLGLGRPSDRVISTWEHFYLPEVVRDVLPQIIVDGQSLTGAIETLNGGQLAAGVLESPYYVYVSIGVMQSAILLALWGCWCRRRSFWFLVPLRLWWFGAGSAGIFLLLLWIATDHSGAWRNENILLLNPLCLIVSFMYRASWARYVLYFIGASLIVAMALKLLPNAQFNHDLLLWLLPVQWVSVWVYHSVSVSTKTSENVTQDSGL